MRITKCSLLSQKLNTREIDVTQEELDHWRESDELIQTVFPHLSANDREFLLTGITPEEWEEALGEEEDED